MNGKGRGWNERKGEKGEEEEVREGKGRGDPLYVC